MLWHTAAAGVQVLVSLQAMVFCPHPFFNEPAWAVTAGTAAGDSSSDQYNATVVAATGRHAVLAPLQNPDGHPHGVFKDVLSLHWRAKAPAIKAHFAGLPGLAAALDRL